MVCIGLLRVPDARAFRGAAVARKTTAKVKKTGLGFRV